MTYHQITSGERYVIAALRQRGCTIGDVARQLERHRSTIGRELTRNRSRDGGYRPTIAIERTNGRRARSRRNHRFAPAALARVDALLAQKWSPEQIAGYLRRHRELHISHETIYRHIWRDRRTGGRLYLRKLPRQADSSQGDFPAIVGLGRKVRGGTRPRLSCGRSWL
jgi:IS30 family transposase